MRDLCVILPSSRWSLEEGGGGVCSLFFLRLWKDSYGDLRAIQEFGSAGLIDGFNGYAVKDAGDVFLNGFARGGLRHVGAVGEGGIVISEVEKCFRLEFELFPDVIRFGRVGDAFEIRIEAAAVEFDHAVAGFTAALDGG